MAAKKAPSAKEFAQSTSIQLSGETLPRRTLEQALRIARVLHETYAGKSATWDEMAQAMEIGSKSPNTKYLIWAAEAYGLISREKSTLTLAETGRKIVAPTYDAEDSEAKIKALLTPAVLSKFYSDYNGYPLPAEAHLPNVLESKYQIPRDRVQEAIDLLIDNARYAGILIEGKGDERARIQLAKGGVTAIPQKSETAVQPMDEESPASEAPESSDWDKVCFYITPIGDDGSESRKHADMMLKHLIEPVFSTLGFLVVRADKIERSGLITQQIFEHLGRARVSVADLSFNNPNAFYELGIRHMTRQPTIQIIRKGDRIPFDVSQGRTITIDTSDVYTVMDRLESARRELTEHAKSILNEDPTKTSESSPVDVYLPGLKVQLPR
jgi:hypothetical protein